MRNLNDVARVVSLVEGKKVNLTIAQVKETIKIIARVMYENPSVIGMLVENGRKQITLPSVGSKHKSPGVGK